ncbi:MAG: pyridoxamine 5'-phosphate oxidase [Succinivibrionaceae bacterium]
MIDVSGFRRNYTEGGLSEEDLTKEPIDLFEIWLKNAIDSGIYDPTGMVVSTVDSSGQPYSRMVLLKNYDRNSLVFFTNYGSRKAQQLLENPKVSILFPWYMLERQVSFLGVAEKLSSLEIVKYFTSRPKDSQIGAWVSHQSAKISARSALESKFMELKQKWKDGEIPVPTFWGGFRVTFNSVEFWQGRPSRLHDRFIYEKEQDGSWNVSRLAP